MESHWAPRSPLARHAAAADLWMELTGRKSAAMLEVAKEAMSKHANGDMAANQAQPAPVTRAPLVGAVAGYAIRKMMKQPDEAPAKTGSAAETMIEYLRAHPRAAAAAGAALLAAPAAGAGYLYEKARHTAGASGKSEYEIDNDLALANHNARIEHGGKPPGGISRLKEKYLLLKAQAWKEGRENPGRAAAYGAIPYGVLAGMTGATVVPRLLRW